MKLDKILDLLNSFEKNAFLKIVDNIISDNPRKANEIEKVLSDSNLELKNVDNINVAKVFNLVQEEFSEYIRKEFANTTSQFDILTDILIKDGNCIMKQDWFSRLYEKEMKIIIQKIETFKKLISDENTNTDLQRIRDYKIYKACLNTAYINDLETNHESQITKDELSILLTLAEQLELSIEEVKLLNHIIVPVNVIEIDKLILNLKNIGIVFVSKKNNTVYVADEVVRILRKVRGKEVADKYFRRTLKHLREPQINLICKKHNIDWRLPLDAKIKKIINEGILFTGVLKNDIHKDDTKVSEKKKVINSLFNNDLKITPAIKGITLEDKISNLIKYFENIENDEKVGISINGYDKLLIDIDEALPKLKGRIKNMFELQEESVMNSKYLLDYNLKPKDIIEIIDEKELESLCISKNIKTRGDRVLNILNSYKDSEDIYFENFENIGFRDLKALKENGLRIKEDMLGVKFEDLTKSIFTKLGFNVDEKLRKIINTKNDKIDIVLNLGQNELILVECKTIKEKGYNKFSSVSRQINAYIKLATGKEFKVLKTLPIAPDFSEDFKNECAIDYELNLSLITASSLVNIMYGFLKTKHKALPSNLLMRDIVIREDTVLKAINR